jgi:hypothetical protein
MDNILSISIFLILKTIVNGVFLWIGSKIVLGMSGSRDTNYCTFWQLCIVAFAGSVLSFIPMIGWMFATLAVFMLLFEFTKASFSEVLIIVIISRIASSIIPLLLLPSVLYLFS